MIASLTTDDWQWLAIALLFLLVLVPFVRR